MNVGGISREFASTNFRAGLSSNKKVKGKKGKVVALLISKTDWQGPETRQHLVRGCPPDFQRLGSERDTDHAQQKPWLSAVLPGLRLGMGFYL
ncbi:MAG: hypothetical protein H7A53_11015 [Akkermansiaceae bacterium]|nr:hypothetical protein [Akkermansiaceae bacterium]